jgi:hypothetical protein
MDLYIVYLLAMKNHQPVFHAFAPRKIWSYLNACSLLCIVLSLSPVKAQSDAVRGMIDDVNRSYSEGEALIRRGARENRSYVSRLTCQQLISEAKTFQRRGDYWMTQGTIGSNPSARGSFEAAEMRYQEYNRRCQ